MNGELEKFHEVHSQRPKIRGTSIPGISFKKYRSSGLPQETRISISKSCMLCSTQYHAIHVPFPAEDKPIFHQLKSLKLGGETIKIVGTVAVKWTDVAYALEFEDSVVQIIKKDKRHDSCTEACEEMLRQWLDGVVAGQQVTWERLIQALRDAGYGSLADNLKELLH